MSIDFPSSPSLGQKHPATKVPGEPQWEFNGYAWDLLPDISKVYLSGIDQSGASAGQVPTWTGSAWVPETPSGGGGSPGGSDKQLQYNNAGAFGGMSGTSWDDANRSLTVTGATVTASKPIFDLSQTWNAGGTAFTGWKFNVTDTASDAASRLFDYQVGGTSKISGDKDGFYNCQGFRVYTGGSPYASIYTAGTVGSPIIYGNSYVSTEIALDAYAWWIRVIGTRYAGYDGYKIAAMLSSSARILWTSGSDARGTQDTGLARNAAGVVEVNNGTAGTLRDLRARNVRTDATTVSSLVAASTAGAGARGFVTDATATTFLSTVAGGGANKVPVVSDGTNWLIG